MLCGWGLKQFQAEPENYVSHQAFKDTPKSTTGNPYAIQKVVKTTGTDSGKYPNTFPKLETILSAHVDDLKGGATPAVATEILEYLEAHFGKC